MKVRCIPLGIFHSILKALLTGHFGSLLDDNRHHQVKNLLSETLKFELSLLWLTAHLNLKICVHQKDHTIHISLCNVMESPPFLHIAIFYSSLNPHLRPRLRHEKQNESFESIVLETGQVLVGFPRAPSSPWMKIPPSPGFQLPSSHGCPLLPCLDSSPSPFLVFPSLPSLGWSPFLSHDTEHHPPSYECHPAVCLVNCLHWEAHQC